ncbi:hypothetical protein [Clostridium butyricum]|uniref:hypothetical protein n=1 Tax=Clostridium butyricum TaxID=1492 RepID=UPI003D34050B
MAYREDNLAKSRKVQSSVVNSISFHGCVHVGQASLTGEALHYLNLSNAKQAERQR